MNNDPVITSTLQALAQFNPMSVFLYGSRSRTDFKSDSDYEMGVVFDDDKYVQRADIHAAISNPNVKAYPFKKSELLNSTFDWPFQKSLYVREIAQSGKTIAGEDLLAQISPPPITTLDLVQDIRFYMARAIDSLLSFRAGDTETSMELFSKSCFYGLRCLEILELKTFPSGYNEIYELSAKVIKEPTYRKVIEAARLVRKTGQVADIEVLYENIPLISSYIEPRLVEALKTRGIEQVI